MSDWLLIAQEKGAEIAETGGNLDDIWAFITGTQRNVPVSETGLFKSTIVKAWKGRKSELLELLECAMERGDNDGNGDG